MLAIRPPTVRVASRWCASSRLWHNQSAAYGLVPRSTASSNKDSDKSKRGGSKAGGGKDTKSTTCSGCGGTYHTLDKCLFREHPDFNKSGSWEKSTALTKLKAKYPDDESRHKLNRKYSQSSCPRKLISIRARKVRKYHMMMMMMTPVTHIVAAADAAADSTMYRECVIANQCIQLPRGEAPNPYPITLLGRNSGVDRSRGAAAAQ